jgi:hypothetical protein
MEDNPLPFLPGMERPYPVVSSSLAIAAGQGLVQTSDCVDRIACQQSEPSAGCLLLACIRKQRIENGNDLVAPVAVASIAAERRCRGD